jgi:filamentous hemagglutinin
MRRRVATNLYRTKVQRTQAFSWGGFVGETAFGAATGALGGRLFAPVASRVGALLNSTSRRVAAAAGSTVRRASTALRSTGSRVGAALQRQRTSAPVAAPPADGVVLSLRYKPGWTAGQRAAADAKVSALNDAAQAGQLRVTPVERSGTSASSRYRKAGGDVPDGSDVDHTIDLQLGGVDDLGNMSPLDRSVNRSLGSQTMWRLRGVELGTCVTAVRIC